jgi:hypothetical protein
MTPSQPGQRNPYKGVHPRGWVRVELFATDGTSREVELIADTGCPFDLIVDEVTLGQCKLIEVPDVRSCYGDLVGGWLRIVIPGVGLDLQVIGFASDRVVQDAQADCPDFAGLLGLPVLRMTEFGGDADWFWIRPAGTQVPRGTP